MITALDTNVLLDVLLADREHGPASRDALRQCFDDGALVACPVVWCEVATFFPDPGDAVGALGSLAVRFEALDPEDAVEAAARWQRHRARAEPALRRIAADFLIGAHAFRRADRLLTRDGGFYRTAFEGLTVVGPG